jgi:hypothetical protein
MTAVIRGPLPTNLAFFHRVAPLRRVPHLAGDVQSGTWAVPCQVDEKRPLLPCADAQAVSISVSGLATSHSCGLFPECLRPFGRRFLPQKTAGGAISNYPHSCADVRLKRGHAGLNTRLNWDEHDRNQAARSTTSVISSCCGAPTANAWAAARIRLMACRAGRP